jgi:hypothetical protein
MSQRKWVQCDCNLVIFSDDDKDFYGCYEDKYRVKFHDIRTVDGLERQPDLLEIIPDVTKLKRILRAAGIPIRLRIRQNTTTVQMRNYRSVIDNTVQRRVLDMDGWPRRYRNEDLFNLNAFSSIGRILEEMAKMQKFLVASINEFIQRGVPPEIAKSMAYEGLYRHECRDFLSALPGSGASVVQDQAYQLMALAIRLGIEFNPDWPWRTVCEEIKQKIELIRRPVARDF